MDITDSARAIAPKLVVEILTAVLELYQQLRQFWKSTLHEGLYEVLNYDAVLEIVDAAGETAIFKKRQKVKFLQDNIIAFQDYVWGDGNLFGEYHCVPGVAVDRYQEGNRWNVLISLRETKSRGDVEEIYVERKIRRGFTHWEEWWQISMQHDTRQLKMSIMFPPKRHCQRAVLTERTHNRTTTLGAEHFTTLPDGHQMLTWETSAPRRFETYTLKWSW